MAKFVREFVVQSLIPWMERCVVEWNEAVRFHFWYIYSIHSAAVFFHQTSTLSAVHVYPSVVWHLVYYPNPNPW